jgi:hypothetical protein
METKRHLQRPSSTIQHVFNTATVTVGGLISPLTQWS